MDNRKTASVGSGLLGGVGPGLALVAVVACASSAEPGNTIPSMSGEACAVTEGMVGEPVTDPLGPYYHAVVATETTDGVALTGATTILDHASVPDGVRGPDGDVLIYYVNGAQGYVWIARLAGASATPLGPLRLNGTDRAVGIVDPDVWRMPDGKVRIAYLAGFGPPSPKPRAICIAESADGLSFTVLGAALEVASGEMITDPSVIRLPDGSWRMAVSLGQQTILARSSDGLRFTRYATVNFGGVPELALAQDGTLRLYVCKAGIESWRSHDGGTTWRREATVVPPGPPERRIVCDPSLVAGSGRFLYKTAP